MKMKFISLILVLASLVACEKMTTNTHEDNTTNESITFNVSAEKGTKAIVSSTDMTEHFGVYGYVTGNGVSEYGYLMSNAEYDKNGDPANSGKYYWPKSDNYSNVNVLFTAYSKYTSTPSFSNGNLTVTVPTLTQALINNPSDFNDVLYAQTSVNHQNAGVAHTRVPLTFNHALAWIEFQAMVENNTTITKVEITNIAFNGGGLYTTGSLILDTKNTMASPAVSGAATKDATLNFATSTPATLVNGKINKTDYSVISDALIVPQDVPTSVTITFNMSIHNDSGEEINYVGRTITKDIVGPNTDMSASPAVYNTAYQASHKYIYKILVRPDGINFDVVVANWTSSEFQLWDATAYVEHFFDKASTMQGQSVVVTMAANSLMA